MPAHLDDLALKIFESRKDVAGLKASKELGAKSMQLALRVKSQGATRIEESAATLEKILVCVRVWERETSTTPEHKSEMKQEVERWHHELDQIIEKIQGTAISDTCNSSGQSEGSGNDGSPTSAVNEAGRAAPEPVAPVALTPVKDDPKAALIALFTLASILSTPEKRKVMEGLKEGRAQSIINFLYQLLSEPPNASMPWLRKHTFVALRKLCGSSMLYPSWYVLKDITDFKPRYDGGAFGDIHSGKQGSLMLCLKLVRTGSDVEKVLKLYAEEAIVWGQLQHPNIVPFYGIFYLDEGKEQICLVSPWMENRNVETYLKEKPDAPRKPLVHDVALGLEYLHKENVIHGDLKAMNILVNQSGRACIADFGSSIIRTDRTLGFTNDPDKASGYTERWVSPELLQEEARTTRASDVWAFGCVCYEILSRRLPFHSTGGPFAHLRIPLAVTRGELPARRDKEPEADPRDRVDDESWELMNWCWSKDPDKRPTCREILDKLESQGASRQDDGTQNATVRATVAGTVTTKVDLGEVQRILDEIDTVEIMSSPVSEARDILSVNPRLDLSGILSLVLENPQKTQALQELKGDRAQLLVNFLLLVSMRSFLSPSPRSDLATRATAMLCRLSETLRLYPQHLVLGDIKLDPEPRAGGFCDIHRGRRGEQRLCVKVFKQLDADPMSKIFVKDVVQWARLDHPNILPFYGVHYLNEDPTRFCIVTPWKERSTLAEYLERNSSMPRDNFIYDIISGLEYLHDEDIVHGRLKMSNVLVDYLGRACITDLGMSTVRTASGVVNTSTTGHPSWLAPELSRAKSSEKPCDIWAFGCICYEVMTSRALPEQLAIPGISEFRLGMDENDDMQELISSCLAREPKERPTAQEITQRFEAKGIRARQEQIQSYLMHRDEVVKTRKGARNNSVMTAERLLRVHYILHKINGDEAMSIHATLCSEQLFKIRGQAKWKELVLRLEKDDAQHLADYLDLMLHDEPVVLNSDKRGFVLSRLAIISKETFVVPRCHELTGMEFDLSGAISQGGGFSDVYQVSFQGQLMSVKMIRSFTRQENASLLRAHMKDITTWSHLSHPNILPFYGVFRHGEAERICLASPWMSNGNLQSYLQEHPAGMPRSLLVFDVLAGLQYLHDQDTIHGDLKPSNVLVSDEGRALLADFGISYIARASRVVATQPVTTSVRYAAPELVEDDEDAMPTLKSDIWSFGCVSYEVYTRKTPFTNYKRDLNVMVALIRGEVPGKLPDPLHTNDLIPQEMWEMMNKCWDRELPSRPTCDEIRSTYFKAEDSKSAAHSRVTADRDAFWETMKEKSSYVVDYERVLHILSRTFEME